LGADIETDPPFWEPADEANEYADNVELFSAIFPESEYKEIAPPLREFVDCPNEYEYKVKSFSVIFPKEVAKEIAPPFPECSKFEDE
jgi:hypothetical protein